MSEFVLHSRFQLTTMASAWTHMVKFLATGIFQQVTQTRALGLAHMDQTQDSGAMMMTVNRLEHGGTLITQAQEPS